MLYKAHTFITSLVLILIQLPMLCHGRIKPTIIFKTNLVEPISAFMELRLNPVKGINLGYQWVPAPITLSTAADIHSPIMEYRWYTSAYNAENGRQRSLYLAPYGRYKTYRINYKPPISGQYSGSDYQYSMLRAIALGAVAGYQWNNMAGFTLDIFVGGGYFLAGNKYHVKWDGTKLIKPYRKTDIRVGAALGFWL